MALTYDYGAPYCTSVIYFKQLPTKDELDVLVTDCFVGTRYLFMLSVCKEWCTQVCQNLRQPKRQTDAIAKRDTVN